MHVNQANPSLNDPLLESIDIRQIYDKFPEKAGGLKELFEHGPKESFFLVKFWVSLVIVLLCPYTFSVCNITWIMNLFSGWSEREHNRWQQRVLRSDKPVWKQRKHDHNLLDQSVFIWEASCGKSRGRLQVNMIWSTNGKLLVAYMLLVILFFENDLSIYSVRGVRAY